MEITRTKFEELALPIFEKLKQPVDEALEDACCSTDDIREVVLVGGSSSIPWVRNWLE